MLEKGQNQSFVKPFASKGVLDAGAQMPQVVADEVGQISILGVVPERHHEVELRSIGGQRGARR